MMHHRVDIHFVSVWLDCWTVVGQHSSEMLADVQERNQYSVLTASQTAA